MNGDVIQKEVTDISVELTEALGVLNSARAFSVGQALRAGRLAKKLTISEVSKALKLSPHQVEAMESDDWSHLPCNTVIRGFVRNYARLVELNPIELMSVLDGQQMPKNVELELSTGTPVRIPRKSSSQHRDYLRTAVGCSALLLAVLVYFFLPENSLQSAMSMLQSTLQSSETTAETVAQKEIVPLVPPTVTVIKEASVAAPQTVLPSTPDPAIVADKVLTSPAPTLPSSNSNVLKLDFSQPSWVEIRDRSGKIIFSQLNQANTQREVEGRPPFALVIGNSSHVTLQYKGKAIDLSKRDKDDVARVTVE